MNHTDNSDVLSGVDGSRSDSLDHINLESHNDLLANDDGEMKTYDERQAVRDDTDLIHDNPSSDQPEESSQLDSPSDECDKNIVGVSADKQITSESKDVNTKSSQPPNHSIFYNLDAWSGTKLRDTSYVRPPRVVKEASSVERQTTKMLGKSATFIVHGKVLQVMLTP